MRSDRTKKAPEDFRPKWKTRIRWDGTRLMAHDGTHIGGVEKLSGENKREFWWPYYVSNDDVKVRAQPCLSEHDARRMIEAIVRGRGVQADAKFYSIMAACEQLGGDEDDDF